MCLCFNLKVVILQFILKVVEADLSLKQHFVSFPQAADATTFRAVSSMLSEIMKNECLILAFHKLPTHCLFITAADGDKRRPECLVTVVGKQSSYITRLV